MRDSVMQNYLKSRDTSNIELTSDSNMFLSKMKELGKTMNQSKNQEYTSTLSEGLDNPTLNEIREN